MNRPITGVLISP